jgi:hypothetical protein
MGHSGTAMQQQYFNGGVVTNAFGPYFKGAHRCFNGYHFNTGCLYAGILRGKVLSYRYTLWPVFTTNE